MASPIPIHLERTTDRQLKIEWDDGFQQSIPFRVLRDGCPCATCMQARLNPPESPKGSLPVLTAEQAQPVEINQMQPVGNYAYNIRFSDGHTTGIFTFDQLRSIGD